jgi:hypothetical protein
VRDTRKCKFCKSSMCVSEEAYRENPFCTGCLHTRMELAAAQDPVIHRIQRSDGYLVFIRRSDLLWT